MTTSQTQNKKRITKSDLNHMATSLYGEKAYCEYIRGSGKHGWYLYKDTEPNFIGTNVNEAMEWLESQQGIEDVSEDGKLYLRHNKDWLQSPFIFDPFTNTMSLDLGLAGYFPSHYVRLDSLSLQFLSNSLPKEPDLFRG